MNKDFDTLVGGFKDAKDDFEDAEKYKNTFAFLDRELECDEHNYEELLKIEPSHLTKAKIKTMLGLKDKWKKENDSCRKKYKENLDAKKKHCNCELRRKEKAWFTN